MKRALVLTLIFALLFCACASPQTAMTVTESPEPPPEEPTPTPTTLPAAPPAVEDDGQFTLRWLSSDSMNPYSCSTETNRLLSSLLFETLITVSPEFTAEPALCTAWETDDGGRSFLLTLRDGAVFSDGSPMSIWDVIYSINRAREITSAYATRLSDVSEVGMGESGFSVRITLNSANPSFPLRLDVPIVKEGSAYRDLPVGSGPYLFFEDENGAWLQANERYASSQSLPFARIELQEFPAEALGACLASGELDLLAADPGVLSTFNSESTVRRTVPTSILCYLGLNTASEALSEPGRRRLINALLDRGSLSGILGGEETYTPLHPRLSETDVESARAWIPGSISDYCIDILTEDYDGDGMLEYFRDGLPTPFGFELLVCSENESATAAARSIADDLRVKGVAVELRLLNESQFLRAIQNRDYDAFLASMRLTADFDLTPLYANLGDDMLRTLAASFRTSEGEAREKAASEICAYGAECCRVIPLTFLRRAVYTRQGAIRDMSPTWTDPFHGLAAWQVGQKTEESP